MEECGQRLLEFVPYHELHGDLLQSSVGTIESMKLQHIILLDRRLRAPRIRSVSFTSQYTVLTRPCTKTLTLQPPRQATGPA